jgi:hypothetical protein
VDRQSRNGVLGLVLIGLGTAVAATGVVLVVPVCTNWSRSKVRKAYERGRKNVISGLENTIERLGEVANKMQEPMGEAAKAAKRSTAVAAGAVESAAHYVKERMN